jgi:hypothetical protein
MKIKYLGLAEKVKWNADDADQNGFSQIFLLALSRIDGRKRRGHS